jgi:hypothetical protein
MTSRWKLALSGPTQGLFGNQQMSSSLAPELVAEFVATSRWCIGAGAAVAVGEGAGFSYRRDRNPAKRTKSHQAMWRGRASSELPSMH